MRSDLFWGEGGGPRVGLENYIGKLLSMSLNFLRPVNWVDFNFSRLKMNDFSILQLS